MASIANCNKFPEGIEFTMVILPIEWIFGYITNFYTQFTMVILQEMGHTQQISGFLGVTCNDPMGLSGNHPKGLRWNLPAAWLPSLQLHLLAALLGVLQWRRDVCAALVKSAE